MLQFLYLLSLVTAHTPYIYMVLSTDHSRVISKKDDKIIVQNKSKLEPKAYRFKLLRENSNFVFKFSDKQLCYRTKKGKIALCDKQKTEGTWELVSKGDSSYYLRLNDQCAALLSPIHKRTDTSELTLKDCGNDDVIQINFMNLDGDFVEIETNLYAAESAKEVDEVVSYKPKQTIPIEIKKVEQPRKVSEQVKTVTLSEDGETETVTSAKKSTPEGIPVIPFESKPVSATLTQEKLVQIKNVEPEVRNNPEKKFKPNDSQNKDMLIMSKPKISSKKTENSPSEVKLKSKVVETREVAPIAEPVTTTTKTVKTAKPVVREVRMKPVVSKTAVVRETIPLKMTHLQNTSQDDDQTTKSENGEDIFTQTREDFLQSIDDDLKYLSNEKGSDLYSETKTVGGRHYSCYIDSQGITHCHEPK